MKPCPCSGHVAAAFYERETPARGGAGRIAFNCDIIRPGEPRVVAAAGTLLATA